MDDLKQTIQELQDMKANLLRRLNEIDVKMRKLTAEKDKLKNVQEKETTAATSGDRNRERSPINTTFRDPFHFISDVYDLIQEDDKLIHDTDNVFGNFFNYNLSENDVLEKMSLLFSNEPDLISGLKLFLANPAAISKTRTDFHEANLVVLKLALRFGMGSQQYKEFLRILSPDKRSEIELLCLDSHLEELFKNECVLNDIVKKYMQGIRTIVERDTCESG